MDHHATNFPTVTAALITSGPRVFIAQRPLEKKFGLLWEFPGGKVEPGESLEHSLIREIQEELCWEVAVGTLFQRVLHQEGDFRIDLHAFWCTVQGGELCLREHISFYWALPDELRRFPFTQADQQLVHSLEALHDLPPMVS